AIRAAWGAPRSAGRRLRRAVRWQRSRAETPRAPHGGWGGARSAGGSIALRRRACPFACDEPAGRARPDARVGNAGRHGARRRSVPGRADALAHRPAAADGAAEMTPGEPLIRWDWLASHVGEIGQRVGEHLQLTVISVAAGFVVGFVL